MDVFLHPNGELDSSPPGEADSSIAKPKFEPKVKPRAKARAPTTQLARNQQLPKAQQSKPPFPVKSESSEVSAQLRVPLEESRASLLKTELTDIKPKLEPEPSTYSGFSCLPDVSMKVENNDDEGSEPLPVKKEDSLLGSPSHVDIEGDAIVREIDVYLCPNINAETKLYFLQYPLRPHWRPYGLEERCDSVRVKPKLKKLELDLIVDTGNDNYDQEADDHLKIQKQTLSSSKIALTTNYAVGLLRGNKLHLAPLDAIVQLRPSMKYLDEADNKKKNAKKIIEDEEMVDAMDEDEEDKEEKPQLVALKVEVKKQETERQEQMRLQSHEYLRKMDEAEPWIPLETHGVDSPITEGIRHILTSKPSADIPFTLPMSQYFSHIVPGRASSSTFEAATQDASANEGLSRSFLDTLPLEQRFEKLLSKGRVQVLQFERLMKLAPAGCSEEVVLSVLEDMAHLVQGCWVAASSLRYSGQICILRDYMLLLFTKNRIISHNQLEELNVSKEMIREVLLPLAVQRPAEGGWEFQESTDKSFLKRHQAVAKEQMQSWSENEEQIKMAALGLRIGSPSINSSSVPVKSSTQQQVLSQGRVASVGLNADTSKASGFSGKWTMSEETRAALPGALREIFLKHNVCSLQLICRSLLETAVAKASAPNANPKMVAAAAAAAQGTKAPLPELMTAISQVASNIDGLYFLTKLGNPTLDPFRDVVIALLRAKGASGGLKRIDIIEASKIALKAEVQQVVYQKVMRELCYTKSSTWLLKPGDGRPSPM